MKSIATDIPGVVILQPDLFDDPRGVFTPMFVRGEMSAIMADRQVLRVNHSTNRNIGTVRGFHLQLPPHHEMKIVQCLRGRVYDVALDLRKDSPTFGQAFGTELDAESRRMLVVPEGFGHAFQTLEPDSDLMYFVTGEYSQDCEVNISPDDPQLQVAWPLPISTLSEKDASSPTLHSLLEQGFAGVELPPQLAMPEATPAAALAGDDLQRQREQTEVLTKMLLHCRTMTLADAGTLYLVEYSAGQPMLRFKCTQNDSLDLDYEETLLPCDDTSMAGYVACTGETVSVEDVYSLPDNSRYGFNQSFDSANGYRSKSMLTLPVRDQKGQLRAVLQLINRKRGKHHLLSDMRAVNDFVLPFSQRDQDLVSEWAGSLGNKFSD